MQCSYNTVRPGYIVYALESSSLSDVDTSACTCTCSQFHLLTCMIVFMQENIFKLKPSDLRQRELGEYVKLKREKKKR